MGGSFWNASIALVLFLRVIDPLIVRKLKPSSVRRILSHSRVVLKTQRRGEFDTWGGSLNRHMVDRLITSAHRGIASPYDPHSLVLRKD